MSQPSSSSSSSFQGLFDAALQDYENQTKTKLIQHPLAKKLEGCSSVDSITTTLREQARIFDRFRDNGEIMKSLSFSVDVLYTLFNNPALGKVISLAPFPPANAIFTGIAVLFTAVKDINASYDTLVVMFGSFENFLSRLSIRTDVSPTPALTNVLEKIIVELLSTLALVTKEVKQGRFKKFIKKVLGENKIEAALQRLDRLTQYEGLATGAQTLQVVNRAESERVVRNIRKWLSPPDPWKNHSIMHEARQGETGMWLVQGDTYAKWKSSGSSSLLWINGKPGAGKSFICSAVIDDIRALQNAGLASLAFFYFDFREDQKKDQRGILSSLLVQLGEQSDAYFAKLFTFYETHGRGSQHAGDNELLGCLKDMLNCPGQTTVHIIIDALDECPETAGLSHPREKVLNVVKELVDMKISNLRICVTSRLEADIVSILRPLAFRTVSLEDEGGQVEDIAEYVRNFVNTDSEMREWKDADKEMVIDVLSKKANGMFRWVVCQLENLRPCIWTEDIRRALDDLPESLDATYARILKKIDEKKWKYAHIFFQCVAVASRPLRVNELAQFLSFDFGAESTPSFRADRHLEDPTRAVLSMCSSLLAVGQPEGYSSPIVQFAHFSAQEYLMSARHAEAEGTISRFHVSMTPAHNVVAQACLGLLLHLDENVTKDSLKNFPLVEYAAQYWVGHAQIEDVSSKVLDGMKRLFDPGKSHLSIWLWIWNPESPRPDPADQLKHSVRAKSADATPLHYAASCGLHDVVKFLIIDQKQEVNARGFDSWETPLHVASRRGHADIAQLLLKHHADGNIQDTYEQTPLHLSSEDGHIEVSRILLESGAKTEIRDGEGRNPLELASRMGHIDVARLLLKHRANPNTGNNNGWTPLHFVSFYGYVGVALVLLEYGADANALNADHATPLHLASRGRITDPEDATFREEVARRRPDIVRLLLQYGSDVHARDNEGRTPFMIATSEEDHNVMQLLLEYGAEDHRQR